MKKLLIWGTGQLAWHTINNVRQEEIIGYVDTYRSEHIFAGKPVHSPAEVPSLNWDAILVSLSCAEEVRKTCHATGIDMGKVIYVYGNVLTEDMNENYDFVREICGDRFADSIKRRYHLVRETDVALEADQEELAAVSNQKHSMYQDDYIRVKTFALLAQQINETGVRGAAAELGVYRGDFAQYINAAFPDRDLYLFDTFGGFDEAELAKETSGMMQAAGRDIFKKTEIDTVMEKMRWKEKVIVKPGFFPDSLNGLEDTFAFVSLDCDWEESLYQGLAYFYPRIARGGYLMMHDYNNFLTCAKKAIARYETELHMRLAKVPICDNQGSLIITK